MRRANVFRFSFYVFIMRFCCKFKPICEMNTNRISLFMRAIWRGCFQFGSLEKSIMTSDLFNSSAMNYGRMRASYCRSFSPPSVFPLFIFFPAIYSCHLNFVSVTRMGRSVYHRNYCFEAGTVCRLNHSIWYLLTSIYEAISARIEDDRKENEKCKPARPLYL